VSKYVLDTNLYITAGRDKAFGEALDRFTSEKLPTIYLSAVVVQEMLAGAIDVSKERFVNATLIHPFERKGRIITPSYRSWKRVGEIIARLIQRKLASPGTFARSFQNDCLLAASCHEQGVTLITNNARDFDLIRKVEPVKVVPPWPG
jgi:predicted nucleic acid-binding protein